MQWVVTFSKLVKTSQKWSKLVEPKSCLKPSFRLSQNYFSTTHFLLKAKDLRNCCLLPKGYDNFFDAGTFTKDREPTEKESPTLTPPVEPSSNETTQFDQAEDEEKTHFRSSRFHMFKSLSEFTSFFVSFVGG